MPRVPTYEQQVGVQNLPGARVQNYVTPEGLGAGVGQALQRTAGVVNDIAQREQEKANIAAVMDADRQLADLEMRLFNDPENGALTRRGRDAFGLPERVFPEWDKQVSQISGRLTPAQRDAFQRSATSRRNDLNRTLSRHVVQESDRYYQEERQAYIATAAEAAAANYTDPTRIDLEADRAVMAARAAALDDGASPFVIQQTERNARGQVYTTAIKRMVDADPSSAVDYFEQVKDRLTTAQVMALEPVIKEARVTAQSFAVADRALYGAGGFDSAVEAVLQTEGGYVADDAGRGETNFGINVSANPDVDVRNLTPDQAKAIYRERYWDAIGADALPQNLQAIAFDAAVNQGVGNARKWIAESGGDPAVFARLRRDHYARLIAEDPDKYQQYAAGWEARVAKFERGATAEPSLAQALRTLADEPDPDVRRAAESRVRSQYQAIEAERTQRRNDALNAGFSYLQGGGTIATMPADVRAAIEPKDMVTLESYERQRTTNTQVRTDPVEYNNLVQQSATEPLKFAERNLVELVDKLSESDLQRLIGAQAQIKAGRDADIANTRKLVTAVTEPMLAQLRLIRMGERASDPPRITEENQPRVAAFQLAIQEEVEFFRAERGKDPTIDDVQKMANRLLVSRTIDGGWFSSDQTVFAFEAPVFTATTEPARGQIYFLPGRGLMRYDGSRLTPYTPPANE